MIIPSKHFHKHTYRGIIPVLLKALLRRTAGVFKFHQRQDPLALARMEGGIADRYPVLEMLDQQTLKCVSCGLCQNQCPSSCIKIVKNEAMEFKNAFTMGNPPKNFSIALKDCIQCGLCQEVCPVQAISMTGQYNLLNHEQWWDKQELSTQAKPPREEF